MRRLWRHAPFLTAGLVLALVMAGFFATRLVMGGLYWSDPRHRDMPIASWMTPRFVAMSWDVPPEVVRAALGLPEQGMGRDSLEDLARQRQVPVSDLVTALQMAIDAHRGALPDD